MKRAYLSIGANVGDRRKAVEEMLRLLSEAEGVRLLKSSGHYETEPFGKTDQPKFVNAAAVIETNLTPQELFSVCKGIEAKLGRKDRGKWGPREADMDIVLFDGEVVVLPGLTIPHPEMHKRRFVLEPLCEIAPDAEHPVFHKTVKELLESLGPAI